MERQTIVNAPAEKVFSYVADLPRHGEWAAHKLKITQSSQGAVGVGTTFDSVGHQMGRDNADKVTITEYAPNEKLVFEAEGPEGIFRHRFSLQAEGGGTRVVKGMEAVKTSLMTKLMTPMIMLMGPRLLDGDLQRIKAKVESSG